MAVKAPEIINMICKELNVTRENKESQFLSKEELLEVYAQIRQLKSKVVMNGEEK